ncbi:MAG: porin [Rhodocyclales bacterium]|nr:porin [Rhodocyclales bacterium]
MQKKLIALAVAGLASTAAFAQSNVTIYGVADAGYVNSSSERRTTSAATSQKDANYSAIDSGLLGGSRIGFKGEEALGNGLKAVFTLEYALSIDGNVGVGAALARQQFVGLNSAKLGQVALGRQYAAGYGAQVRNDAMAASGIGSVLAALNTAGGNTIQGASNARINNSVTYTSPNWSGFTVSGIYGFAEAGGTTADGISQGNSGFFGAGLNYANGPLNLDLVYQSRRSVATNTIVAVSAAGNGLSAVTASTATQDNINEWGIGGSYDFKVVKLFATYQDQNDNNGTSSTEASNRVWSVGAAVPVFGNGTVRVSYANLEWDRKSAGGSDAWALGYTHALSKRTTLYTTYASVDNDNDTLVAAGPIANTRFRGERNGTFSAGINHTF